MKMKYVYYVDQASHVFCFGEPIMPNIAWVHVWKNSKIRIHILETQ